MNKLFTVLYMNIEQLYQVFLKYPFICTDTRHITPNALYFALKGDSFDGNTFAANAIENGCSYAIVDKAEIAVNERYIVVDDVICTLQKLANYHRQQLNIPILAITGTNGKTTTKELIGKVLSDKYVLGITTGNLNNHIGVPLTLLAMNKDTSFGVVEMGANHVGEIADLCKIAEPNYGVITNVGKAHLEGFGSIEGVRKAKGELYDYLEKNNGIAFVNTDDTTLLSMVNERKLLKTQAYSGSLYQANVLTTTNNNPFLHFTINNDAEIDTSLLGAYNLNNVLAAMLIGEYVGIAMADISEAIQSYHPENNRSQLVRTANNTVYMDAYNANPSSMEVSLLNFSLLNEDKKLLILGDMLELGDDSLKEHQHIIDLVKQFDFQEVWLVGSNFGELNNKNYSYFNSVDDVIKHLKEKGIKNYTILIKGSRGIRLEKTLEYL